MTHLRPFWLMLMPLWLLGAAPALAEDSAVFYSLVKDGETKGYLLGTIHSEDPRVTDLPDSVFKALDDSTILAVEVVLNSVAKMSIAQAIVLTDGRTLPDVIGQEMFDRVMQQLAKRGVPAISARMLKPWAVAAVIGTPVQDPSKVLDMMLQERALNNGQKLRGLETASEQTASFDAFTMEEQKIFLKSTLDNLHRVDEVMEEFITAWVSGDLLKVVAITQREKKDLGEKMADRFYDELVVKRNHRLFQRALAAMGEGKAFIAVGAMHLPDESGLINQFRQAGYTVEPVK